MQDIILNKYLDTSTEHQAHLMEIASKEETDLNIFVYKGGYLIWGRDVRGI